MSTPVYLLIVLLVAVAFIVLERTGSAITMANTVLKLLGNRFPGLAMSLMGMTMRGVQKQNSTVCSAMRGTFGVDARAPSKLMAFLRRD